MASILISNYKDTINSLGKFNFNVPNIKPYIERKLDFLRKSVTAKCLSFIGEFVNHVVQETRSTSYNSTDINDFFR